MNPWQHATSSSSFANRNSGATTTRRDEDFCRRRCCRSRWHFLIIAWLIIPYWLACCGCGYRKIQFINGGTTTSSSQLYRNMCRLDSLHSTVSMYVCYSSVVLYFYHTTWWYYIDWCWWAMGWWGWRGWCVVKNVAMQIKNRKKSSGTGKMKIKMEPKILISRWSFSTVLLSVE